MSVSRQSHAVVFKYALQLLFWLSCVLRHCGACFLSGGAEPGFPSTRSLHGDALVPVSSSVYRSTMVISVCKCFSTAKKLLPNFRSGCPGRIFHSGCYEDIACSTYKRHCVPEIPICKKLLHRFGYACACQRFQGLEWVLTDTQPTFC